MKSSSRQPFYLWKLLYYYDGSNDPSGECSIAHACTFALALQAILLNSTIFLSWMTLSQSVGPLLEWII